MSETELQCPYCAQIAIERKGICPRHLLAPIDERVLEEVEKRKQTIIRQYVVQSIPPTVETVPEHISERTYLRVQSMKEQLKLRTFDEVLEYLAKELAFRYDPEKTLETRRPLIITGPPETGKTMLCKSLIENFEKVFVVDVSDEYRDLKLVHSGELFGDVWRRENRFRIIPHSNPIFSKFEMDYVFGYLVAKMKEPESPMIEFCFVIEDAVRFSDNQAMRSFISESRKFVRKTIVISQDLRAFEGMGEAIKP